MITALKRTAIVCLFGLFTLISHAQLLITENTVALQLAQKLVGDGITISNVQLSGVVGATGVPTGFFRNVSGTQINLDSGIALSTGKVLTNGTLYGMNGPATNFASTIQNTPGDGQLDTYLSTFGNPYTTHNAVILEFDFVPIGDTVKFNYVFGSEEYPSFTCSNFNDIFAFFISGPGITGTKNIALIPGTNIPVAINSVNADDPPGALCTAMGAGSPFAQYFVNNQSNGQFSYGGHTTVLTALSAVTPCQSYHLKIAIADVGDESYDSGVFLKARSLTSTPLHIVNNNPVSSTGQAYVIEGCTAGAIKIDRGRKYTFSQPVNLTYAGTAQNSVDIQTLPTQVTIAANDSIVTIPIYPIPDNIVEGDETFKIYITFGSCGAASNFYADSLTILVRDQLRGTATVTPSNCANNSGTISIAVPAGNGNTPYTYSINGGNFQSSNVFNGLASGTNLVTIRDSNGCVHNIVTNVGLNNNLTLSALPADTAVCKGATFVPRITSAATQYAWTPTAGLSASNVAQPTITVNGNIQYVVTAYQGACIKTSTINITALQPPTVSAGPDITLISGDVVQIKATAGPGAYLWTPATGLSSATVLQPSASPSQTTTYTLTATSPQGCISKDDMKVTVLNCVDPMDAFTPNGDGMNDVWLVNLRACYTKAIVEVFNRYGNRVYRSDNYQNNWDGKYEGKNLPDGTYYYVITLDLINGKKTYVKGNVTILR